MIDRKTYLEMCQAVSVILGNRTANEIPKASWLYMMGMIIIRWHIRCLSTKMETPFIEQRFTTDMQTASMVVCCRNLI